LFLEFFANKLTKVHSGTNAVGPTWTTARAQTSQSRQSSARREGRAAGFPALCRGESLFSSGSTSARPTTGIYTETHTNMAGAMTDSVKQNCHVSGQQTLP